MGSTQLASLPSGFVIDDDQKFDQAFKRTLGFEGGYTVDNGGATNLGVTQTTYDNWRKKQGLPTKPVNAIDPQEARQLYKTEYFDKPGFSNLTPNVAGVLFDYGVNAGPQTAAKALQKAVGASPDGVIGPKTLKSFQSFVDKNGEKAVIQKIIDDRQNLNNSLIRKDPKKYKPAQNGWQNRINALKSEFDLGALNPLAVTDAQASEIPQEPLPDGFQIDQSPQESSALPEGFQLEPQVNKAKSETIIDKVKNIFRSSPEDRVATAANIYAIAKTNNLPMDEVARHIDTFQRDAKLTGIKPDNLTNEQYMGLVMAPFIAQGTLAAPVATALTVGAFSALDKIVDLNKFVPEDASDTTKTLVNLADFIGKGAVSGGLTHGIIKKAPGFIESYFQNKVEQLKIPKDISISRDKIASIFGTPQSGEKITPEELAIFKDLGLNRTQLKEAVAKGVNVTIPGEKIVTMIDKPGWKQFKDTFLIGKAAETFPNDTVLQAINKNKTTSEKLGEFKTKTPIERAAQHGEVVGIDAKSGLPVIDTSVKPSAPVAEDIPTPQQLMEDNAISHKAAIESATKLRDEAIQSGNQEKANKAQALIEKLSNKPVVAAQTSTPTPLPTTEEALAPSTGDIPIKVKSTSVRDHTQSVEINKGIITVTNRQGKKKIGSYKIPLSKWEELDNSFGNPNYNKKEFINKINKENFPGNYTEERIGEPLISRIEDSQRYAIDQAYKQYKQGGDLHGQSQEGQNGQEKNVLIPQGQEATPNAPVSPLHAEALKYRSAEEFVRNARGNATQYGKYSPQIRATSKLFEDSDRISNLGVDPEKEITIYRGVPDPKTQKIVDGDFVVTDRQSAESYAGKDNVISKKVKAKDLITDSASEFDKTKPFGLGAEFTYSDSKNNLTYYTDSQLTAIFNEAHGIKPVTAEAGKGKPKADVKKYDNTYTAEDKADIKTLADIEINMPNGEVWTYTNPDSMDTIYDGNPSGHSKAMQEIGPKESFKILNMAIEGKPLTKLQKEKVDALLADLRANIKPSLERLDNEIAKTSSELSESETKEVISTFENEEGIAKPTSQEASNITPSGQIRPELLPPQKTELFQEEGELFKKPKGNKGIDASGSVTSIDKYEPRTEPTGSPEDFKLFKKVQELAKKWIKSPIGEGYTPKGTGGVRFRDNGTILVKSMNSLSTIIHEVTHDIVANSPLIKDIMRVKGYAKNGNPIYAPETRPIRKELTNIYVKYYSGGKADHPLATRVNEGLSVLLQRAVEAPALTAKEFPTIYKEIISKGGKYYDPRFTELMDDASGIVKEYQSLSPLKKMGARVVNTSRDIDKKSFLSLSERVVEETADRIYPIEKMAKETGIAGTVNDPSLWARAYNVIRYVALENINSKNGYVTIRNGEFKKLYDFNWKDLLENLHKEGGDKNLEDFSYWLVARRIHYGYEKLDAMKKELIDLKNEFKDVPKEEISREDVKNLQNKIKEYKEYEAILAKDNIDRKLATSAFTSEEKRFANHAEMFDKLVRADLDLLHLPEVQLINDKRYEKLSNEKGYAPFQRDLFNEIIGTPSDDRPVARPLTGKSKISSMLGRTGSELPIVSPVYGAMMNHLEILKKANRQIIYNIIGDKVASHYPEIFRSLPLERAVSDDGRISYPQEKDKNIMMTFSNYERKPFLVDEEVKALIDELFTFEDRHILEKALVKASSMFTKGTTGLYPPFAIANIIVDQFTAAAQTKNNLIPVMSQLRQLFKMLSNQSGKEAQYFKEYLMLGGERQTYVEISELSPEDSYRELLKERDLLHKAIGLIGDGVNILALPSKYSEIITRGTEYVLARMNGKPQLAALEEAGRVTAPFHHEGRAGGHVGRSYVKSMPYFKARMQVIAQMLRSLSNDKKSRNRALFVIAAITAANVAAMMYLINNASDDQKEDYNALSPRELSGYIFFPRPGGKDLIRIRVPEQMNFVATLTNMLIADRMNNAKYKPYDYVNASTAWLPDQLNVTDPQRQFLSLWPQIISPAAGIVLNKRTYPDVRDLESQSMQARPPKYRYYENTSKAAIMIGQKLGISPIKVDFLIEGYLGRSTRFATGKEIPNPLIRKVYLESSRQLQNYYDMRDKVSHERKALRDDLRKEKYAGEEEDLNVLSHKLSRIDKLLSAYRTEKKVNDSSPDAVKLRRDILDEIDSLPSNLK